MQALEQDHGLDRVQKKSAVAWHMKRYMFGTGMMIFPDLNQDAFVA